MAQEIMMRRKIPDVTLKELKDRLNYDKLTGKFIWVKNRYISLIGKEAGTTLANGYRKLWVGKEQLLAHRVAVFYVTGNWPSDEVDHINGVRDDNRWANLRECDRSLNRQNVHVPKRKSKTGFIGVIPLKNGRFQAAIGAGGRTIYLGVFGTAKEASEKYLSAKKKLHPGVTPCYMQS